jgi:C4-dicarboxylate transporter
MNSLLFNSGLILLSSLTVTQFVADAFSQYISTSSLDVMFRSMIKHLFILEYFYQYFVNYAILVFAALGFVFSIIAIFIPKWKTKDETKLEEIMHRLLDSKEVTENINA